MPPPGSDIPATTFEAWQRAAAEQTEPAGHYLNGLVLSPSPYLRQHARNPIHWRSWGKSALKSAADENKLIFLSIGYSACHWCHVMNRESFSDPATGRLLNENYVAIKVDREALPDVDRHYAAMLARVKGSAGWPINVVLDAGGKAIFIDSYLSRAALFKRLKRFSELARTRPGYLSQSAKMLASVMQTPPLDVPGQGRGPIREEELRALASSLTSRMDPVEGGLSGHQKFPAESVLVFLQDIDQRHHIAEVREAWERQLTQMARRGIYDHVHGGFYRYATDRAWVVPHYEKMLYNQALLLQAYAQGMRGIPNTLYSWVVRDIIEFADNWLRRDDGVFYSSLSAESDDVEGRFYIWSPAELRRLPKTLKDGASLVSHSGSGQKGLRGVYFERPEVPAAAELRTKMRRPRQIPKPAVDQKIISAWNAAWLSAKVAVARASSLQSLNPDIETFAEQLWRNLYAERENTLYRFVMGTHRSTTGTLEDYALMCRAYLDVYDLTRNPLWLKRAKRLGEDIQRYFWQGDTLVLRDLRAPQTVSTIGNDFVDGEIPNAGAVALQALWRLARRTGDDSLRFRLDKPLAELRRSFRAQPLSHVFAAVVLAEIDLGAVDEVQYFGGGVGRLEARATLAKAKGSCQLAAIDVSLAKGWHVNANEPLQDHLKATRVTARIPGHGSAMTVLYPNAERVRLEFEQSELAVYGGDFTLQVHSAAGADCTVPPGPMTLDVELQACSDRICRRPEVLRVALP